MRAKRAISFFNKVPAFLDDKRSTSVLYLILKSLVFIWVVIEASIMQDGVTRILSKLQKYNYRTTKAKIYPHRQTNLQVL